LFRIEKEEKVKPFAGATLQLYSVDYSNGGIKHRNCRNLVTNQDTHEGGAVTEGYFLE
jgi:hypothetical protein